MSPRLQLPEPHRGPAGVPRPGQGPAWLSNYEEAISREQFAESLLSIAQAIKEGPDVEINAVRVTIPSLVDCVVRYERTPHGTYALIMRGEWAEPGVRVSSTKHALTIRSIHRSDGEVGKAPIEDATAHEWVT